MCADKLIIPPVPSDPGAPASTASNLVTPSPVSSDSGAHRHKPGLLRSLFSNKCPRCRTGNLFLYRNPFDLKHMMQMPENCPVCGQQYEIEVGFFYGTGFVSYALSVIVCVASFIAWKIFIGMSLHDNRLFWWIGVNGLLLIALQPLLMRLSRAIWLYFFVWYDPEWEKKPANVPERVNQSVKNDW